jgi:hypothetical protein
MTAATPSSPRSSSVRRHPHRSLDPRSRFASAVCSVRSPSPFCKRLFAPFCKRLFALHWWLLMRNFQIRAFFEEEYLVLGCRD